MAGYVFEEYPMLAAQNSPHISKAKGTADMAEAAT
jgi:hypothetical protein